MHHAATMRTVRWQMTPQCQFFHHLCVIHKLHGMALRSADVNLSVPVDHGQLKPLFVAKLIYVRQPVRCLPCAGQLAPHRWQHISHQAHLNLCQCKFNSKHVTNVLQLKNVSCFDLFVEHTYTFNLCIGGYEQGLCRRRACVSSVT